MMSYRPDMYHLSHLFLWMSCLSAKWVRLTPNGTNLRLVRSDELGEPKCTEV